MNTRYSQPDPAIPRITGYSHEIVFILGRFEAVDTLCAIAPMLCLQCRVVQILSSGNHLVLLPQRHFSEEEDALRGNQMNEPSQRRASVSLLKVINECRASSSYSLVWGNCFAERHRLGQRISEVDLSSKTRVSDPLLLTTTATSRFKRAHPSYAPLGQRWSRLTVPMQEQCEALATGSPRHSLPACRAKVATRV